MDSTECLASSAPTTHATSTSSTFNPLLLVSKCIGDKADRHPLTIAMVQYAMAATKAVALYSLSVICSLVHSVTIIATIQGLDWLQTFWPLVLEWDSFLFGVVFLTMEIDLGSMDPANKRYYLTKHAEEAEQARSQNNSAIIHDKSASQHFHRYAKPSNSVSSIGSNSSNSSSGSGKRVTFHEQVMVFGGTAAAEHSSHVSPIDTRVESSLPLCESPTRTHFPRCASPPLLSEQRPSATTSNNNLNTKRFIHKIMHPHQHKREQQQQQQLQQCLQQYQHFVPTSSCPCPELTDSCASSISSTGSGSSKKSLAQRLGLKKKKHQSL
ncbi:hypothetical protein BG004_006703 [Podila humilis]|nr:hypothetical protein BG004_006703 [Podila humilis]